MYPCRERKWMNEHAVSAIAAFMCVFCVSPLVVAQTTGTEDTGWRRTGWSYGAGAGVGTGPFATDSGPWVDVFGVVEAPLSHLFYFRGEPGLTSGWMSDSASMYIQADPSIPVKNEETFHAYGFMGRALVGVDFTDWATLRLGGVGGYLAGSFESTVCPSESYSRGQYGLLAQIGVRLGASRRFELAVQGESLAKFANPRCRPQRVWIVFERSYTYLRTTEPSRGSLAFLSARLSYVWY